MRLPFALALALSTAATAAEPQATLAGDATDATLTVRGSSQPALRLTPGAALRLELDGPAHVGLAVRIEARAPKDGFVLLELDGAPQLTPPLGTNADASARSDRTSNLTRPTQLAADVGKGHHVVSLRWPRESPGDALVVVSGVQLKPVEIPLPLALPTPPPRATAADPLALAPLAPAVAAAKPASAMVAPPPAPAMLSAPDLTPSAARRYELSVHAGAQRSTESFTDAAALGNAGARFATRVKPLVAAFADLDASFSRQQYQAKQLDGTGHALARADLDERRVDAAVGCGYDLGPWLLKSGALEAVPFAGAQYSALRNGGFPLDLAGPTLGVRARLALSPAFALRAGARWSYNLLKGTSLSAVGTPVSDLLLEGGVSLPVAGGYAFELGYRGDLLALTYDTRVAHGMSAGVSTVF